MSLPTIEIGIIGGSGLYKVELSFLKRDGGLRLRGSQPANRRRRRCQMDDLKNRKEIKLTTPYGNPSDAFITGDINGVKVNIARDRLNTPDTDKYTNRELPVRGSGLVEKWKCKFERKR
eukprot:1344130-Amorphochlora_amoeboformis.AAC.2